MTPEERAAKRSAYGKLWYARNREKVLADKKEQRKIPERLEVLRKRSLDYANSHKAERAEYQRMARAENPEVFKARAARSRAANAEKCKARCKAWYAANRERVAASSRAYKAKNKEKLRAGRVKRAHIEREQAKLAMREKRKDPVFRAKSNMRSRMWHLLKESKTGTVGHIPFSGPALRAHLEPQFKPGMTWENYGRVWHVDHIKPCALFDFTNPVEVEACFALSNLQPLWAEENKSKGDRYPYQSAA